MTDTVLLAVLVLPALVIAIVFHEVAHGWTAYALGDPTAKNMNRLSLNPLRHVDPVGTIILPGAMWLLGGPIFGWAKPVPVRKDRLDNPRYGMMAVAAAGPGTNLVLALIGALLLGLIAPHIAPQDLGEPGLLAQGLFYFIMINVFLAFFNLLPIPPFDGSHIVEGLLPRSLAVHYAKFQQFGMLLLIVLIAASWAFPGWGLIENTIGPPVDWAMRQYLTFAQSVASIFS